MPSSASVQEREMLAVHFVSLSVGEFLPIPDLASCEAARLFSPIAMEQSWKDAARRWLPSQPLWRFWNNPFLENGVYGKRLISAMTRYRRALLPMDCFSPWIVDKSFRSIHSKPSHPVQPDSATAESAALPAKPQQAIIPVAIGTNVGQALVSCLKFAADSPHVGDNLCIGIACTRAASRCLCCQTVVSLAPFSGKCFIEHNGVVVQTQALPQLSPSSEVSEGSVWVHITPEGSMRFVRQFKGGPLEDTGLIPHEAFDARIQCYFPIVTIWHSCLQAAIDVSVEHSGYALPESAPFSELKNAEIDCIWSVFDGIESPENA